MLANYPLDHQVNGIMQITEWSNLSTENLHQALVTAETVHIFTRSKPYYYYY